MSVATKSYSDTDTSKRNCFRFEMKNAPMWRGIKCDDKCTHLRTPVVAFTSVPGLPDAMAFTWKKWRPDLFWKAEYQSHANGARAISEVFLIAVDAGPAETLKNGLALDPVAGKVSILSPMAFAARFPGVTAPSGRFGGYRISVEDLEAVRTCMGENGVAYEDAPDSLWIGPESAHGCVIEFGEDQ